MKLVRLLITTLLFGFSLCIEAGPLSYSEINNGDLERDSTTGDCHPLDDLQEGINTITGITTGTTGGGGPTDYDCFILSIPVGLKIVDTSLEFGFVINSTTNSNPSGYSVWSIYNSRGLSNILDSSIIYPGDSSPQPWSTLLPLNAGDKAVEIGLSLTSESNIEHSYTLSVTVENGLIDNIPDNFFFTTETNVALGSIVNSNAITVSGINTSTSISIQDGDYRINGGSYTSTSGTVSNNDTVEVRHTSGSSPNQTTTTTLTIGGVNSQFTSTTIVSNTTPSNFSFASEPNVDVNSTITSNPITVSGINTSASITIQNGEYRINNGSFTSTSGTVNNGDTVEVRHTSASSPNQTITTILTIGGVDGLFQSTTIANSNEAPIASFTATPISGTEPLTVNLNASGSSDSDGSISSYTWNSTDSQIASGISPTFTYNTAGTYTITLTVTDNDGATDTQDKTVFVTKEDNEPPVASFTATPTSGLAPLTVNFDATDSSDSDGSISSYAWSSSDGQAATGINASFTYVDAGEKTITLTVTDDDGVTHTSSQSVTATLSGDTGFIKGQVYDACTGESLDFAKFTIEGPELTASQSNSSGEYSAKLATGDYAVTVNDTNNQERTQLITITKNATIFSDFSLLPASGNCSDDHIAATSYKAIILSGTGPFVLSNRNHIWPSTQTLSDRAYKALRAQGYSTENIYYLTADANDLGRTINGTPVVDGLASTQALEESITQWASDVEDVVIYIASHGGDKIFLIDENTTLEAKQLKQWVDTLQSKISGRVTVILDACFSGSFVPELASASNKRYIISSTGSDQLAVISNKGSNSFSYFFWDEVVFTGELREAYRKARQSMSRNVIQTRAQKAVLDANGDGIESAQDYETIKDYCFGECIKLAGLAPVILSLAPAEDLNGQMEVMLSVKVRVTSPLSKAWITIQRPDYKYPKDTAISGLPRLELSCAGDTCEGIYDNFNVNGTYRLNFYVEDNTGEVSLPRTLELKQTRVDTLASTAGIIYQERNGLLSIQDVDVGGDHYWVELKDKGGYNLALKDALPLPESVSAQPATFLNGILRLPRLYLYGSGQKFYIDLVDNGALVFQPNLESIRAVE